MWEFFFTGPCYVEKLKDWSTATFVMGFPDQGGEGNHSTAHKEECVYIAKPNVFNKKQSVPVTTYSIQ